jgi:hypothetical protein
MSTVEEIKIVVRAEVDEAIRKMNQLETSASKNNSTFAKMRDVMQGPVAVFNQVIAVIGKVKQVSDAMEASWGAQAEAAALLANAVKTTGASAWTSTGQLEAMAGKLQQMTKYGDETVETMQTVLLGFRNITGKEFDQATTAVLDMATVMKMDLTSAAQAVGKALDDPIRGVDSLSRQGFKFTAQEKEMMKAMVEAGNIAGAQKIILDELEKTYGGAAEESGKLASNLKVRLANSIGEVSEEIGRQISNNLAPWRLRWIAMADAIAVAMKAQNDFKDAMDKASKGTATTDDRITIATKQLRELEATAKEAKASQQQAIMAFGEGMGGDTAYIDDQVEAQKQVIASLKEQERLEKLYAGANAARNQSDIDKAKKAADDAAWQTALDEKRLGIAKQYSDSMRTITLLGMTGKEAEEARLAAVTAQSESYANLIVSMNLVKGATTDALDASLQLQGILERGGFDIRMEGAQDAMDAIDDVMGGIDALTEAQKKNVASTGIFKPSMEGAQDAMDAVDELNKGMNDSKNAIKMMMMAYDTTMTANVDSTKKLTEAQREMESALKSGFSSMSEAFGAAMVLGEDGWKAFGRAGLNAVAAVLEALAAAKVAEGIAAGFSVIGAPLAPGYFLAGAALYAAAGATRAIPMAEGGSGTVTKPTLFLAGEAGPESFAFGGANNKLMGGKSYSTTTVNNTVIQNIGGSVIAERQVKSLAMSGLAQASRGY